MPLLLGYRLQEFAEESHESENCDWLGKRIRGDRKRAVYQPRRLTEEGAIGLCAVAFAILHEGEISEITTHETGVDYWVDDRRASLKSAESRKAARGLLEAPFPKREQLRNGSLFQAGFPGYVFVVDFGQKESMLSHHR